ncbi:MAG: pentapeptide repeat-containing protein [Alphaproteobacteria bacterium]
MKDLFSRTRELRHAESGKVLFSARVGDTRRLVQKAVEDDADLEGVNLSRQNLSGARYVQARFNRARFIRANLTRAELTGLNGHQADFSQSLMPHARMDRSDLREALFRGAILRGANFREAHLQNARFGKHIGDEGPDPADLMHADFRGADLRGANFAGCDLTGAHFNVDQLEGAIFAGAKGLDQVQLYSATDAPLQGWVMTEDGPVEPAPPKAKRRHKITPGTTGPAP